MLKKYARQNQLNCFSPPVMLATMLIEFGGAIYIMLRYKLNNIGRIIVAFLVALGVFQLAEYMICEEIGMSGLAWSRIGYVAITLLPPLGISLALRLANKRARLAEVLMYALCGSFIVYFGFISGAITGQTCQGNYVIFDAHRGAMFLYAMYYYILMAISGTMCFVWSRKVKDKKRSQALRGLMVGHLVLIIPTATVALLAPETRAAIPSIMCGFAVFLAIILLVYVMPRVGMQRNIAKEPKK